MAFKFHPFLVIVARGIELLGELEGSETLATEKYYWVLLGKDEDTPVLFSKPYDTYDAASDGFIEFEKTLLDMARHVVRPN